MAKSFCNGCNHWTWLSEKYEFGIIAFHYCKKFLRKDLKTRKEKCNGKFKE